MRYPLTSWRGRLPAALPVLVTLGLMLVGALPARVAPFSELYPCIPLIAAFYWSLFCPGVMPHWQLALLGLAQDVLFGLPVGVSPLVLMGVRELTHHYRRYFVKELFLTVWGGFCVLAMVAFTVYGLVWQGFLKLTLSHQALFMQWAVTIAVYPLAHIGYTQLYARLPKELQKKYS